MSRILIVGSTHGHERIGLQVIEELKKITGEHSDVEYIIGNPEASKQNAPFIESDLNRVFPGKETGTLEEMRAFQISPRVLDAELVIDIHSTNTTDLSEDSMLIVTHYDEATKKIIDIIHPPKVLVMKYKNTANLISQAKIGIAFEYGKDGSNEVLGAILYDIANILVSLGVIRAHPYAPYRKEYQTETFEVYDAYKKDFEGKLQLTNGVKNFTLVKKDSIIGTHENGDSVSPEDFYPILFGENRYKDILGFKARKIS